jgi:hypothetical protein
MKIAFNLNRLKSARKAGTLDTGSFVSIRPDNKRAHTLGHVHAIIMTDVTPCISAAGIAGVRRSGHRAVCAWLQGDIVATSDFESFKGREYDADGVGARIHMSAMRYFESAPLPLTFNPHTDDTFVVIIDGKRCPITHAKAIIIEGATATAYGATLAPLA